MSPEPQEVEEYTPQIAKARAAARVARKIAADISDRRGIGQEFQQIDADIRKEIMLQWAQIIMKGMP